MGADAAGTPPVVRFSLRADQVPAWIDFDLWSDAIRWMIAVMDPIDADLRLASDLLREAVETGRFDSVHDPAASELVTRVIVQWRRRELICQRSNVLPFPARPRGAGA